jgi:hypothetical protein
MQRVPATAMIWTLVTPEKPSMRLTLHTTEEIPHPVVPPAMLVAVIHSPKSSFRLRLVPNRPKEAVVPLALALVERCV